MLIRHATRSDLDHLAGIEAAADQLYAARFGATGWDPPPSGRARAEAPGFLLVAADGPGEGPAASTPYGFVHVLEVEGQAHLEQLSVHPDRQRCGTGSALVRGALEGAFARGHRELTLMTYVDVPWNAPFYARLGFAAVEPRSRFEHELVRIEHRLGLDRHGPRTLMVASATREGVTSE
jgi:GNAT superfamily N-acetyltransferase